MTGKISEDTAATTLTGVQYAGIQSGANVRVPHTLLEAVFASGSGIANVVEDITPQLGGNLDLNTFTVGAATAADLTKLNGITATATELNYVDGVTSAIQTQIDGKQAADADLTTWAGLTPSANAQSLVTAANYAAMRTLLDLEAGTDFYSIAAADAAFQPKDADLTSWAGVTRAAGFDTFAATPSSANLKSLVTDETGSGGALVFATSPALATPTLTDPIITGAIKEDEFTITDAAAFEIDPGNGSVQEITLGDSRTPKATNFASGESVTLRVADGTAFTITWTDATFGGSGVIWKGGTAPTLATSGWTEIELWKRGSQVYGAEVGDFA